MKFRLSVFFLVQWCISSVASQGKPTTLRVVSHLTEPYLIASESSTDGKTYEGFVVDVLNELAKFINFEYVLSTEDQYGFFDSDTKNWTGMIGDLVNYEADLAFADITITPQRLDVVAFSYPFQTLNLAVIHHESNEERHHHRKVSGILVPFSAHEWLYIISVCWAYFFVLFLIGRISYQDWRLDNARKGYRNEFGLFNSFWFMVSSLFLRTTHSTPRGIATRLLSIFFYCFSFFVIVQYISNMMVLSISDGNDPHQENMNIEDLLEDSDITFAAIKGGSTSAFLRKSKVKLHQRIFKAIPESNFFENYREAETAMKGDPNVVLVVESPQMEYITSRLCSYQGMKLPQTQRAYGIATPLNSPYTQLISKGLVAMEDDGKLSQLYQKWWVEESKCSINDGPHDKHHIWRGSFSNIRSACIFFGIASAVSIVVAVLEYCVKTVLRNRGKKESVANGILEGLKVMCTCRDRRVGSVPLHENETINVDAV